MASYLASTVFTFKVHYLHQFILSIKGFVRLFVCLSVTPSRPNRTTPGAEIWHTCATLGGEGHRPGPEAARPPASEAGAKNLFISPWPQHFTPGKQGRAAAEKRGERSESPLSHVACHIGKFCATFKIFAPNRQIKCNIYKFCQLGATGSNSVAHSKKPHWQIVHYWV